MHSGLEDDKAREVSEREIHAMVDEGARVGVFQETEHDLLMGVFSLDDRKIFCCHDSCYRTGVARPQRPR